MRRAVESDGFRADCLEDAAAALDSIRRRAYSLAIVVTDADEGHSCSICREASTYVPVISVIGSCQAEACVHALECGADDCVPRSIPARELIARVRNLLRRFQPAAMPAPGSVELTIAEMRVHVDGQTYELTKGEAEVLAVMAESSPTPITIVDIAERLGARRGTVESRIKSLRTKLGSRLISRGRLGYEYVGEHPND